MTAASAGASQPADQPDAARQLASNLMEARYTMLSLASSQNS